MSLYDDSLRDWMAQRSAKETASPIEALFLTAFTLLVKDSRFHGAVPTITPQHPCGRYTIDFATQGQSYSGSHVQIAVECDGHKYHDATAEASSRDKRRDRRLVESGYHVLRFTGKELFRNPFECAQQTITVYSSLALKNSQGSV